MSSPASNSSASSSSCSTPTPADSAAQQTAAARATALLQGFSEEDLRAALHARETSEGELEEEDRLLEEQRRAYLQASQTDAAAAHARDSVTMDVAFMEKLLETQAELAAEVRRLRKEKDPKREIKNTDIPSAWRDCFLQAVVHGYEVEEKHPQWLFIMSSKDGKDLNKRYPKLEAFDVATLQHDEATFHKLSKEQREVDKLLKEMMIKMVMPLRILARWAKEMDEVDSSGQGGDSYDASAYMEDLIYQIRDTLTWARMRRTELVHGKHVFDQSAHVVDDKHTSMLPDYVRSGLAQRFEENMNMSDFILAAVQETQRRGATLPAAEEMERCEAVQLVIQFLFILHGP